MWRDAIIEDIELLTNTNPHFCRKKPAGETIFTPEYV
jgi:hypothetical protein